MKVLNLMLSRQSGGLEVVAYQYARLLAQAGCESVLVVHKSSPYAPPPGVKVHRLSGDSVANPANIISFLGILRQERPNVVIGHGGRGASFCSIPFLRKLAPQGTAFVGVLHGENAKRFRRLDHVIAVSEVLRRETISRYGIPEARISACPNAVSIPPDVDIAPLPCRLTCAPPVIGFLGRFDVCKGLDVLIEACADLRRRGIVCRLAIGGDGPERERLRHLAAIRGLDDMITWEGWVTDRRVFFRGIDLLVMPSREEAVGLVALEALSYGRAVAVSDCPGPKSIVESLGCAVVFPRESPERTAEVLAPLVQDGLRLSALADIGREAVKRDYSEAALTARLMHVIARIMV